jgi:hypothetical protein
VLVHGGTYPTELLERTFMRTLMDRRDLRSRAACTLCTLVKSAAAFSFAAIAAFHRFF